MRLPLLRGLLSALACLLLPGCLLDRLWETHRQFYGQPPQILIQRPPGGPTSLAFLQPTLLEQDVEWLLGEKPTRTARRGKTKLASYALARADRTIPPGPPLAVLFRYVERDGTFRLAAVILPKAIETLLTPELLEAAIAALRHPVTNLWRRQVTLDLRSFANIQLPRRREVIALLGRPDRTEPGGSPASYRFHLQRADRTRPTEDRVIQVSFTYGPDDRIRHVEGTYLRYQARLDLDDAEAVVQVL